MVELAARRYTCIMTYIASGELGGTTCSSGERKSCPMLHKIEKKST